MDSFLVLTVLTFWKGWSTWVQESGRVQRGQGRLRDTKRNIVISLKWWHFYTPMIYFCTLSYLSLRFGARKFSNSVKSEFHGNMSDSIFLNQQHVTPNQTDIYHQSLVGAKGGRKKTSSKEKCPRLPRAEMCFLSEEKIGQNALLSKKKWWKTWKEVRHAASACWWGLEPGGRLLGSDIFFIIWDCQSLTF